jgi:hypothetical protein
VRTSASLSGHGGLLILGLCLLRCGGGAQPAEAPSPPAAIEPTAPVAESDAGAAPSEEPSADAGPVAWKDMSHGQRAKYMKTVVLPKMKAEFTAFNAKDFGEMNCTTCHGKDAKEKDFKMPNPDLPKLSPEGNFKKHKAKTPEILKFMLEKVEPGMAALLGEPPFDPKTHEGFSCFDCHTQTGK